MSSIAWVDDHLERKEIAEFLTSHIDRAENVKVVNIDSPWGTGKTYFLKNWRLQILENNRPAVYFNAWENDYSGDPLISIVANIRDELGKLRSAQGQFQERSKDFLKSAGSLIAKAAPAIAAGLIKKHVLDYEDLSIGSDAVERVVEGIIESNQDRIECVKEFKRSLTDLFEAVRVDGKPVYIFIDELDRCRPTYAIELLERVKHFFDVDGCAFIVASDTFQLSNSVCAVYGEKFSARDYLKRFFDLSYSFEAPNLNGWVAERVGLDLKNILRRPVSNNVREVGGAYAHAKYDSQVLLSARLTDAQYIIVLLAQIFDVDLRQLERIISRIESVYGGSLPEIYFYVAYLTFLLDKDEQLFEGFVSRGVSIQYIKDIQEKYPSKLKIPQNAASRCPHEFASEYRRIRLATPQELSKLYNSVELHPIFEKIVSMVKFDGLNLDNYTKSVKLAVKIDQI